MNRGRDMTDATKRQLRECIGQELVGIDGDKIGKITDVYLGDETNRPEWFAVATGMFGRNVSFVPIAQATAFEGNIAVPYTKGQVKDAPNVEPDGDLSADEVQRLYAHYEISPARGGSDTGRQSAGAPSATTAAPNAAGAERSPGDPVDVRRPQDHATASRDADNDAATGASGEAPVTQQPGPGGGVVRLRKWVETEYQTITVPVQRERVQIERDPTTDDAQNDRGQ
jgi:sporulation protein YlmC with PRC-barrel domain